MPVDTPSAYYDKMLSKWTRCRIAYNGSDDVKGAGTRFLPALDSHAQNARQYEAYKVRALYYNATGRTVDGLVGAMFAREPEFDAPPDMLEDLRDVTLTAEAADAFAASVTREVFVTGRYGVLVEMADETELGGPARPYWVGYRTEDIVSTRSRRIRGDEVLTRAVLREVVEELNVDDPFMVDAVEQYRVLSLADDGGRMTYTQEVFRRQAGGEWRQSEPTKVPLRRGEALPFIPLVIFGPNGIGDTPARPPLLDLVDVNLSHYRTMADLEHGRHYVALPTPWVSGLSGGAEQAPLRIGSSEAWILEQGGQANMLEFTGQGLGALQTADIEKRHMMATLGARLLEAASGGAAETATAVQMRHSGDHATLRSVASAIELGLTVLLRWHGWWVGTEGTPMDVEASAELNKDFYAARLSPDALKAWVFSWQSGAASFDTMFRALQRGDAYPPGWTIEDEMARINRSGTALVGESEQ